MAVKLRGKVVIGQSGGPTAAINASLVGAVQEALRHEEIEEVYGALHGIEGVLKEELVDLGRESPETIEGLRRTPSAALGSCRYRVTTEDYERILEVFQAHNVRYFFYIGGNDSMDTAHKIGQLADETGYELRCMGIPKTIDNDLAYTDHCPGYGSVARFIAMATRDAGKDTEAIGIVDKVKIIECMGRNAGWITAASVLGKEDEDDAPHLIYVPERPIIVDRFLDDVQRVYDRLGYVVIAVCEGAKGPDGKTLVESRRAVDVDAFGHAQRGGVADFLCQVIKDRLGLKARFDKPGTIQRMSMVCASPVDLEEAYLVGQMAVRHAVEGVSDCMVTLVRESDEPYRCTTGLVELEKVALAEKLLPDEYIDPTGNFVTQAFIRYARPLIGGPLPSYARLEKHAVAKLVTDR
ncbi:MAG: 6-phosphofructokinase [Anaerolineae bacterium]